MQCYITVVRIAIKDSGLEASPEVLRGSHLHEGLMGDCESPQSTSPKDPLQRTDRCKRFHALKYTHAHSFCMHVHESVAINLKCRETHLLDYITTTKRKEFKPDD